MKSSRMQRGLAWLAVGVFLCAALAPMASRGLAAWNGTAELWAEICTVAGLKSAKANPQSPLPGPSNENSIAAQDCVFCLPSQGQAPLPASPAKAPAPSAHDTARYLLFFIGSAPAAYSGSTAQSRAPPAFV